ncbi:MAG: hypothetical protein BWY28_02342 [bacterium ADurb.Bin236]|nr:MAG: hypothetical protein BWY28_02342 [bacterium ADurb.Bin236]
MSEQQSYPSLKNHFTRFCYPFLFEKKEYGKLRNRLSSLSGITEVLNDPHNEDWKARSEYFLPPLRRIWYPHFLLKGHLVDVDDPSDIICHFKYDVGAIDLIKGSTLSVSSKFFDPIPIVIRTASITISYLGIGFLTFEIAINDTNPTFDKLLNLNSSLRMMNNKNTSIITDGGASFSMAELLDSVLDKFRDALGWSDVSSTTEGVELFGHLNDIYYDRVLCFSYACIDADIYNRLETDFVKYWQYWPPNVDSILNDDPDKEFGFDRWNYHFSMWKHAIYGFSKEGGVVFSSACDSFNEHVLPNYFGTYYYDIFLIAVMQRMILLRINRELSNSEKLSGIDKKAYNRNLALRRDLLEFVNKCVFTQCSNYELGQLIWHRWKIVFEMENLLDEVKNQCEELSNYMEVRRQMLVGNFMNILSFFVIPVSLILSLFGANFIEFEKLSVKSILVWFSLIITFVAAGITWIWLYRKEKTNQ